MPKSPAFILQWATITHRWPRYLRVLSRGRGAAPLPMSDEAFCAGERVGELALGEGRADAFDGGRRLRRDAQGRLTGRSRFEVGVGLFEIHATEKYVSDERLETMNSSTLIQNLWNCCNVLRESGRACMSAKRRLFNEQRPIR